MEWFVHEAFLAVDPTACHVGGNAEIRDHQLRDNSVWVNTKSAWYESASVVGFSPVKWAAEDKREPNRRLDAVALVPLLEGMLGVSRSADGAVVVRLPELEEWWLVPASALRGMDEQKSMAKSVAPYSGLEPYKITADNPLTSSRLDAIIDIHKRGSGDEQAHS